MSSKELFEPRELNGNLMEYMIYFLGLGEDHERSVSLEVLLEEMPHEDADIAKDLEKLDENGYVESFHQDIYPVDVDGFNEILGDTGFEDVDPTFYRLDDRGFEYVEEADLRSYEENLRYVFSGVE